VRAIHKRIFALILITSFTVLSAAPPYPNSLTITDVSYNWSTYDERAPGSDNWAITWADDDNQYASWGDGGGFGGTNDNGRVSLGFARVSGAWNSYSGQNVWGGYNTENPAQFDGKCYGILCVNHVIYMWRGPGSNNTSYNEARIYRSTDHCASFTAASWAFLKSDGIIMPTILNFGKDYAGARDNYIYHYFIKMQDGSKLTVHKPGILYLLRVSRDHIMDRSYYESFSGTSSNPAWSSDINAKTPVFQDANGVGWCMSASYNAPLQRYLLITEHDATCQGNIGVFDAPEPWGPWTTVQYTSGFSKPGESASAFYWNFSNKWLSADGKDFTLVFTGTGTYDSWNTVRGHFTAGPPDTIRPNAPTALQRSSATENSITLSWTAPAAASDGDAASSYILKRNGAQIGETQTVSFTDNGLNESTQYGYEVYSKDNTGNLSASAATGSFSTEADNAAPTIAGVSADGDPTKVVVVFSEALEPGSAEAAINYGINNGIQVSHASLGGDGKTVTLTTSAHGEGVIYALTVNNVTDNSLAKNAIAADTRETYSYITSLTITLVQYLGSATPPTTVEDGFMEGAVQANDRAGSQWTDVPAELSGLTYLLTARDDKNNIMPEDGVMYRVNAGAACTVFVLFQTSLGAPTWIGRDNWQDAGLQVTADGDAYSVYKKYFTAGDINLERQAGSGSQGTGYVFKLSGGGSVNAERVKPYTGITVIDAYPNPFNPTVSISITNYTSPASLRDGQIMYVRIYDICGRRVADLTQHFKNGIAAWNAEALPSGTYLVKAASKTATAMKFISLIK